MQAYYNPPANEIVFPAGILQGNYFSINSPAYINYGSFGAVAGHELSVSFLRL
jgi:predicted metalloendopeptidase